MVIKIYLPDLNWEILPIEHIENPGISIEYDIVRELDGLDCSDGCSNIIFLVNKSREINPVLAKALGKTPIQPKINWFMVNTRWYWRWSGNYEQIKYYNDREVILKAKCPIPQEDIEMCIIAAERINKIDQLINKE